MSTTKLDWKIIDEIIARAFAEDIGDGDVSTNALFSPEEKADAYMIAKAPGVIAGLPVAERVFRTLDENITWKPACRDGEKRNPGELIVEFSGSRRALLSGERLALNILQRMSGIATMSAAYAREVVDFPVEILDTRKTLPGLRILEKYAVAVGGATNHRYGLFDGIMLKDNHIKLAGGIATAVARAKAGNPKNLEIEVETTTLAEVEAALEAGADIIMLDNMSTEMMREAVEKIAGRAKVEASGGVTIERLREIAATGVDYISVGALTHSVQALDISLYFR